MKKIYALSFILVALFATGACAQSLDLAGGSIGDFLSNTAKNARAGYLVNLQKQQAGFLAVPYPEFKSADGTVEYGAFLLGADLGAGVSGTAMHGAPLILPMFNLGSIPHIAGRNPTLASHTVFPSLGDVEVGIGLLPLPVPGAGGKWVIGNQVVAAAQVGL